MENAKKYNMKTFLILISFMFMSCKSHETNCNNDYNLKNRVQNVEEITKDTDYEIKSIYSLNEDDYVLSIEEYSDNHLFEKTKLKYDKNNIIEEIIVSDSLQNIKSKSTFIKNNKNQIVKTLTNGSVINYYYSGDSELSNSGKETDSKGNFMRSWKVEYKNNLVSVQSDCEPNGKTINQTFFEYNDNNDLIEVTEKDKNGQIINKQYSEYKYDNRRNWIEKTSFDINKNLISTRTRKIKYW